MSKKIKKEKLAIITKGGGMNCAYSAGALHALATAHKLQNPDVLIGSSGSAGSLAYYTTGQYEYIKDIWTNLLTSKKFISLNRFYKIMDIDYLIDVVFRQKAPLDTDKIYSSKIELFISSTEYPSGNIKYFTNNGDNDIFEILRASKAIPLVFNKKVTIDDVKYIDGDIAAPLTVNVKKAISEGVNNIIIIMDNDNKYIINKIFWTIYSFFTVKKVGEAIRKKLRFRGIDLEEFKETNIFILKADKKLKITSLDNDPVRLCEAFEAGHSNTKDNEALKAFIKPFI